MALGDSIAAGYDAVPSTRGYVYNLYMSGAFGKQTCVILLLSYRHDAGVEVHPGNAGHQAIANAFKATIVSH